MRLTTRQLAEAYARRLLRALPGWRTVAPTHAEVQAVAYVLLRFRRVRKVRL